MGKSRPGLEKINRFFQPLLEKYLGRNQYAQGLIKAHWAEIIGEELADKCLPLRVDKHILHIMSESSVLNHHLLSNQQLLMGRINEFVGFNFVRSLFFSHGSLNQHPAYGLERPKLSEGDFKKLLAQAQPARAELDNIQQLVEKIQDESLKSKLLSCLIIQKKYRLVLEAKGYVKCLDCEQLISPGQTKCDFCKKQAEKKLRADLRIILEQVPHLNFDECQKYLKCDRILFIEVQRELLNSYRKKIQIGQAERKTVLTYCMLISGLDLQELSELDIERLVAGIPKYRI